MKYAYSLLLGLTTVFMVGCETGPNRGKGFSLPQGDVTQGKATFVELACNHCHSTDDVEQLSLDNQTSLSVKLGGPTSPAKTYGELVTSIINPSHILSKRYIQGVPLSQGGDSPMQNYNDVMTVTQLVDLVTYLEDKYEVMEIRRTEYPKYRW